MSKIVSFVLNMTIKGGKKVSDELDLLTKNPKLEQEKFLLDILNMAKDTTIGKEYDFASIKSIKDYSNKFPLTDYDFYSDKIERLMNGEKNILSPDDVVHFNVTSGTMGNPKKIPVTEKHVSIFSKYNARYLNYVAYKGVGKKWINGKGLSLSEGTYELLPTGVSVGCASSLHTARMAKMMPFMKMDSATLMYTSPKEAKQPSTLGTYSRYLHALFALEEENITYGNVTFSSLLLELFRFIENRWEMLCDDIELGKLNSSLDIPDNERVSVEKKLKPNKNRADFLREIFKHHINEPFVKLIWPDLEFFICVGGAGFLTYTNKLKERYFGNDIKILFLGLSASEGLFSVPLNIDSEDAVFIPNSNFYEFIPIVNQERDLSNGIKYLWELELNKQYEMVITNLTGLYRYQIKDVIEVVGYYNKTPIMHFVNRQGFAINMCAEKTSEKALQYTVEKTCKELNLDMYDYCINPCHDEKGARYIFLLELNSYPKNITINQIQESLEKHLIEANPDYLEELKTGNLQKTNVCFLQQETFMLYRDLMVLKGRNIAQLKPMHVTNTPFLSKFFMKLIDQEAFK